MTRKNHTSIRITPEQLALADQMATPGPLKLARASNRSEVIRLALGIGLRSLRWESDAEYRKEATARVLARGRRSLARKRAKDAEAAKASAPNEADVALATDMLRGAYPKETDAMLEKRARLALQKRAVEAAKKEEGQ